MGWLIFHRSYNEKVSMGPIVEEGKKTIWTCAMHPQIRIDHPDKCPICGMDLIPLEQEIATIDPDVVVMSDEAVKLAEIQTSIVTRKIPVKHVRLFGKIQADERLVQTQAAHIPGRIEKLLVSFTGEEIKKGQTIAQIYSPGLVIAQKELLEALEMKDLHPQILDAAREKLRQWKLTDNQIAEIEKSGKVKSVFDVSATVSGIVVTKFVNAGDYVAQGAPLFEVADLSRVWVLFDAYENDLPWIKLGDKISFSLPSQPGNEFSGTVTFIDPIINSQTRVAGVRTEVENPGFILKPGMFVTGIAELMLSDVRKSLIIPQSAILWTGTRSVIYSKVPGIGQPGFKMKEITLGPALDDSYIVLDGLNEGEEIVTNGTFILDAAAQLSGKPSMMNTTGGKIHAEHNHTVMEMHGNYSLNEQNLLPKDKQMEPGSAEINQEFKKQLTAMYKDYLIMKDAFIASDPKIVARSAEAIEKSLGKANIKLLSEEAHNKWMILEDSLREYIRKIKNSSDIEIQRADFATFNQVLYSMVKSFQLENISVYYQFCPMALEGKGAFWFSDTEKVLNPYFGKTMLTCGETKEILKF